MTVAVVLAAAAGVLAAGAIVDVVETPRRRSRRDRRSELPGGGHLGAMTVLLARLARRGAGRAGSADLEARIAAAGAPLDLSAADVVALKAAAAVLALMAVVPVATGLPGRLGIAALACAPAAGFLLPDVVLARRARLRAKRMSHELADVLDLLRVAMQAGLPIGRALSEVGRRCHGLLAAELAVTATRLRLGATRGEAFGQLVARCPLDAVATLAAAVGRADRHGAPLAPVLEAMATRARADHARALRDEAAKAAPKIQLVVALVLVPAVMLLVAAVLVQTLT